MSAVILSLAAFALGGDSKDPNVMDRQRLQGTWTTVSLVANGKKIIDESAPPAKGPATKLAYEGDKWLVVVGDKTVASGKFTLDAAKTPKEIDILDASGKINDKTQRGVYSLEGDTYKYCLAKAGAPRPTDFTAPEGSGRSLGVMKREKAKKDGEKKP